MRSRAQQRLLTAEQIGGVASIISSEIVVDDSDTSCTDCTVYTTAVGGGQYSCTI